MEELLSAEGNKEQLDQFGKFEKATTANQKEVQTIMDKINRASLSHINNRISPFKIVGVRCSKPKASRYLMIHITRRDDADRKVMESESITLLSRYG